jgi:hypothetical protein
VILVAFCSVIKISISVRVVFNRKGAKKSTDYLPQADQPGLTRINTDYKIFNKSAEISVIGVIRVLFSLSQAVNIKCVL